MNGSGDIPKLGREPKPCGSIVGIDRVYKAPPSRTGSRRDYPSSPARAAPPSADRGRGSILSPGSGPAPSRRAGRRNCRSPKRYFVVSLLNSRFLPPLQDAPIARTARTVIPSHGRSWGRSLKIDALSSNPAGAAFLEGLPGMKIRCAVLEAGLSLWVASARPKFGGIRGSCTRRQPQEALKPDRAAAIGVVSVCRSTGHVAKPYFTARAGATAGR